MQSEVDGVAGAAPRDDPSVDDHAFGFIDSTFFQHGSLEALEAGETDAPKRVQLREDEPGLDADIFGPSMPKMFGAEDEQLYMHEVEGKNLIIPLEKYGVKMLSLGFLVDKEKAILWRGAMASNALRQLINEADWGELDYFVIDLPPGTSDIHLTLVQTLPITGAIVVTTPQQVALADARKGISMFMGEHVGVPVLGIVENMSWFTPASHPDEKYFIFGHDGGKQLAETLGVELLGQIPLVASICKGSDDGQPVVRVNDVSGAAFKQLATRVMDAIDRRNQSLPPTEVVQTH